MSKLKKCHDYEMIWDYEIQNDNYEIKSWNYDSLNIEIKICKYDKVKIYSFNSGIKKV